jgi:hypothetical protein
LSFYDLDESNKFIVRPVKNRDGGVARVLGNVKEY